MRTRFSRSALAFAFPAMFLLAGCPIYGSSDDPTPCTGPGCGRFDGGFDPDGGIDSTPGDAGPTSCRTHGDCPTGLYCDDRDLCIPSGTCTDDGQCESGFVCDFRSTCVPQDENACRADNDCETGERCIEGFCRTELCQLGTDCREGQACVNGACTNLCASPSDCGSGSTCDGGFCRPVSECASSAECMAGEHCVDARCLPDCQVGGDSTCGSHDYCGDDQFCRPDWRERPFCSRDQDCESGSVCREGVCRTPCPGGTDAECRATDASLTCGMDNLCISTVVPECALSVDCSGGRECVNAICRN